MPRLTRRRFLGRSLASLSGFGAGVLLLPDARSVFAAPANDRVILAAVGIRGRGAHLAAGFLQRSDCRYAYVADVDARLFAQRVPAIAQAQGGREPKCVQDFRRVLDDKSVDAMVIATPDHWHALATVWSCQAGKHVYVEKPASHNCWEGRQMVAAARKYDRVVQVGTQTRSAAYARAARRYVEEGRLGGVHMCRIYNQKFWGNLAMAPDAEPPEGLDWEMWNGPAPQHRYNPTLHHYWHHFWRYSGGDIANDASHQIDLARWLIGAKLPKTVYSTGGRFASRGAAETPDTQVAVYECERMVVTFELTLYTPYMLKTDPGVRNSDMFPYWQQNATRVELFGTEGMMIVGRHGGGWQVFDRPKSRKPVVKDQMYGRFPDPEHKEDFIQAMRTGRRPNADIEEGHLSALWIHYANISYRLGGRKLRIDPTTQQISDDPEAMELFRRTYRPPWVMPEEV